MKKAEKAVLGTWRITGMEVWDTDYFDMEAPAHITIRSDLTGEFQFGLVQGDLDARVSSVDGVARVEFSCSGVDENDPVSRRGWMVAQPGWKLLDADHPGNLESFACRFTSSGCRGQTAADHPATRRRIACAGQGQTVAEVIKRLRRMK